MKSAKIILGIFLSFFMSFLISTNIYADNAPPCLSKEVCKKQLIVCVHSEKDYVQDQECTFAYNRCLKCPSVWERSDAKN